MLSLYLRGQKSSKEVKKYKFVDRKTRYSITQSNAGVFMAHGQMSSQSVDILQKTDIRMRSHGLR